MGREQHVPDSIACTQNQTSRVGVGCGAAHALRVPPSHTLDSRVWEWAVPHAVKRKKKDSLTLLPQNHLDHFNNLLLDLWYRTIHDLLPDKCTSHPCCRLTPVRALKTTSPATSATISSRICGTGTSTICCTIRFDIHSSGITLITSTICSRICGTGTARTVRCTRRTCSQLR